MPIQGPFVDPAVLLGKVKQATKSPIVAKLELGPSPPHDDEHEDDEPVPPQVGGTLGAGGHYLDVLDQIWAEFDTPEERTAARLKVLFEKVVDEAARMNLAVQDYLNNTPNHKVPLLERYRLHAEFLKYLKRLNGYRVKLDSWPPETTDTESVYVGLVQTRQGAGPVPDCVMHLYFQNQLDVLAEHIEDMSVGFVARVFDALADLRDTAIETQDEIRDAKNEAKAEAEKWRWVVGAAIGTIALAIVGAVTVALTRGGSGREPAA